VDGAGGRGASHRPRPPCDAQMTPAIEAGHVVNRYGQMQATGGVSLDIAQGEFSACSDHRV
jgi:adhesin HecA-like repeat protein